LGLFTGNGPQGGEDLVSFPQDLGVFLEFGGPFPRRNFVGEGDGLFVIFRWFPAAGILVV